VALIWLLASAVHLGFPLLGEMSAKGHPSVIVLSLDTLRADRSASWEPAWSDASTRRAGRRKRDLRQGDRPGAVDARHACFAVHLEAAVRSPRAARLPEVAPRQAMLAESFRDAGYRTAAFTADGYVAASFGFDQGFDCTTRATIARTIR
jgi:hypothetical protein